MDEITSLDADGLASWFSSTDLCQEACKLAALAPREPEQDAAHLEAFAIETLDASEICTTHPAVISFVKRQSVSGFALAAPRFVTDTLLPYLENVVGMEKVVTLPQMLQGFRVSLGVDFKRAVAFDANPDSHSLIMFLDTLLQQRLDGEIERDGLEQTVRSLALLHYALRVNESGITAPVPLSANISTMVSPARGAGTTNKDNNININNNDGNNILQMQASLSESLPCSLPASPKRKNMSTNDENQTSPFPVLINNNNNNISSNNNDNGVDFHDDHVDDLPPMMLGCSTVGNNSAGKTPALPKQEPLSGSRRQAHRRWQEWREIGTKAFSESNLPISVGGVSYTPLACLTEALEEFLLATNGGVCAALTSTDGVSGGEGREGDGGASSSIGGNYAVRLPSLSSSPSPTAPAKNDVASFSPSSLNFQIPQDEDLAQSEAELWASLSKAMPLGKSAVTVAGHMHTKESAMAKAVQCDTLNADRWLDLARLLPSETGKKRISKKKKSAAASNKKKAVGMTSSGGYNTQNSKDFGSPARTTRNFGNLLNFGSPTPTTSAKRKFDLNFDDYFVGSPGVDAENAKGNQPNSAAGASADFVSISRKPAATREFPALVDGRVITRVVAYSESLKLDPSSSSSASRAEVWSELGLHMPLHPPNDSVFINNSSYSSRRCHETALEMDKSLADSWLDLGWQLLEDKKSTAINGKVYGATECFKEALIRVPSDLGEAWSLLAQSLPDNAAEKVEVGGETFTKVDCFRQALKLDPRCISAWIGLGRMLPRGSTTSVNGKEFTQLALFYHALEMDDSDAVAWNGLGAMLGPTDKAVFRGETLTRRQCYLRALDCDPFLARVWNNLGLELGDPRVDRNDENHLGGRTVDTDYVYFGGKKFDSKAAFIRALHCEGGNVSTSWVNLGMLLRSDPKEEGGTAVVVGKTVDKKRCYYEAVRSNERNAIAWNNLGAVMSPDENVVVNGVTKDKLDCYQHALENDESLSNAWYNVVCVILNKEQSALKSASGGAPFNVKFRVHGEEYSKVKCLLNAVDTNPENGNAWKMLLQMMEKDGVKEVTKRDGGKITTKECKKMIEKFPPKE